MKVVSFEGVEADVPQDAAEGNEFDIVILGAGSGGYACALRAAQLGLSVALVEKDKVGGTCLHVGCIPTKALLHAAEVADAARESEKFGVQATLDGIDMAGVNSYKDGVVGRLYKGLTGLIKGRGITVVEGAGRLTGPHTVEVDGTSYVGKSVVLASGSYSRIAPRPRGRRRAGAHLRAGAPPGVGAASVIVLGGGVIGCEFASVWRSFGAEVTIIEALPHLVPAEDEQSSKALERAFRKRKIAFSTGTRFESVKSTDDGVTVTVEGGKTFEADLLLVAVGRGPVTDGLGYDDQGIAMERGFVTTDERCRTNVEGVYAVGDIVPGLQLAHRGFQQGVFVAEEIAGLSPATDRRDRHPACDLLRARGRIGGAHRGPGPGPARRRGRDAHLRPRRQRQEPDPGHPGIREAGPGEDGPVVGVHMVGARVGELIGEAQLIYNWDAHPEDVAPFVHAHPTQNEALGEAHLALAGKPLHAHS